MALCALKFALYSVAGNLLRLHHVFNTASICRPKTIFYDKMCASQARPPQLGGWLRITESQEDASIRV